jgi:hypothetical protein
LATCIVGSAGPDNVRLGRLGPAPLDQQLLAEVLEISPIQTGSTSGRPENNDPKEQP